jgi:hypothetical protein
MSDLLLADCPGLEEALDELRIARRELRSRVEALGPCVGDEVDRRMHEATVASWIQPLRELEAALVDRALEAYCSAVDVTAEAHHFLALQDRPCAARRIDRTPTRRQRP